jgi:hypothetical protein
MAAKVNILRAAAALLLATAAAPALAGKTAVGGIGGMPVFVPDVPQVAPTAGATTTTEDEGDSRAATTASAASPGAVAAQIDTATQFCARLPQSAYVVDCMAERLEEVSRAMPATGDLAAAKASLAEAARDLSTLARNNADSALPPANARIPGGTATRRPLVAVTPARRAAVNQQAAAILERTETVLLRSSGRPATMAGYRQIASAVGSAKVLLRST